MNRTADLEAALSFVIGRVNQQAALSGEPLDSNCQFERRGVRRAVICCDDRATHTDAASTVKFRERSSRPLVRGPW